MKNDVIKVFLKMMLVIIFTFSLTLIFSLEKKEYKIYIISDTLLDKFVEIQNGFMETLDKELAKTGIKARYTFFDTKTDMANVPGIIKAIQDGNPDLIAVINSPDIFADTNISLKLADTKYKFVSENCIPVQSGSAKTWEKPGGNITGVGVFVQFNSILKLAKIINPKSKKLIFWSWDAAKSLNEYFEKEVKTACKNNGFELAEFKLLSSAEEQFEYMAYIDKLGPEYIAMPGLSVWVHKDGTPANMSLEESKWVKSNLRNIPVYEYDETAVKAAYPAGACVIWYDIGVQMAEKGIKILNGAKPGDLSWEYPRKYNLVFNLAAAKQIGLKIPQNLINAAYRVYTDFDGNFVGKKN
jgi:putative ABC transport system substrate-binding protein